MLEDTRSTCKHEIAFLHTKKSYFLFKNVFKDCILFLERGEEREKEKERNINVWLPLTCPPLGTWPAAQAGAPTWNGTGDLSVHKLTLNPLTHTSQG